MMVSLYPRASFIWGEILNLLDGRAILILFLLTQGSFSLQGITTNFVRLDSSRTLDSLSLVALYEATNGDNWVDSWDLNAAMNQWKGISIHQDRVTTLVLKNKNLSGSIPAEMGQMDKLTIIDLRENDLTGSIPPEIGNMDGLRSITLFRNKLTGPLPATLGNLTELQTLSVFENSIEGPLPAALGSAANLELVDLHDNQITGEIPGELFNLSALRTLNLGMNELQGEVPASLENAGNLESLWLFDNQLSGMLPASMNNLLRLKNVFIHRNKLSGLPEDLSALDSISTFSVFENEIRNLPDLSHVTSWNRTNSSSGLIVRSNNLTFDDLIANQNELLSRGLSAAYMPQGTVLLDFDTVLMSKGDADVIQLGFDETVDDNQYIWLKGNDTMLVNNVSFWQIDTVNEVLMGQYHVIVSNGTFTDMTLQTSSFYINVSNQTTASVDHSDTQDIRIFPNPSTERKINLVFGEALEGRIYLHDHLGIIRYQEEISMRQGSNTIYVPEALVPGMYYVIFRYDATNHSLGKWILMP